MKTYTDEEVIKIITDQLDECLSSGNAEVLNWKDKIVEVDQVNKTITIKFDYYQVDEDDYLGIACY